MTTNDLTTAAARDPHACPFMHDGFDFTSPDLLHKGMPVTEFAELRKTAPVWWNAQSEGSGGGFHDGGYWVVSKHRHVREISKNDENWSTNANGVIMRFEDTMPPEALEITKALLINHDPPEHTRLRKLVSRLFTPRAVHALQEEMEKHAAEIVQKAAASGTGDFVHQVAVDLPLIAIADLLGVPSEDREKLFEWSNSMMNADDPEFTVDPTTASAEVLGYAYQMAEQRKQCPAEDIVSELVNADLDGESLSEIEFGYFFILLSVAGNETTRNAISHGMVALSRYPDERAKLWNDFDQVAGTAVEEIVRWATPVIFMRRNLTEDVELGGVRMKAGDKVSMWYNSANRDETKFANPWLFDVTRNPNPHFGYGAGGVHFCLGANLARREIRVAFEELRRQVPDIVAIDEPAILQSAFIHGIKRLQVGWTPPA